jgi:predicted ester cyclase
MRTDDDAQRHRFEHRGEPQPAEGQGEHRHRHQRRADHQMAWSKRTRASNTVRRNSRHLTCDHRPAIVTIHRLSTEQNKLLVRRLIDDAVAKRNLDVLDHVAAGEFAEVAKRWVRPFQNAFPDFEMKVVELIAENDTVVAHFKCSGTHRGEWLGFPPTGRRFEDIDEIYIFRVRDEKLVSAYGVEDNLTRLRQLGVSQGSS